MTAVGGTAFAQQQNVDIPGKTVEFRIPPQTLAIDSAFGVSPQSVESHAKFREKYKLPFVLLADEHKAVIKMYGVNGPLGIGVRRASYLIDGGRRIRDAVLADFMIAKHADFVRKAILLRAANPQ